MRNLLALFALLLVGFCGASYYRGWCSVESLPSESGKSAFRVEFDRTKIAGDVRDCAGAIQKFLSSESPSEAAGEKKKENGPNGTPGGKP
jgi:hypothetical protein